MKHMIAVGVVVACLFFMNSISGSWGMALAQARYEGFRGVAIDFPLSVHDVYVQDGKTLKNIVENNRVNLHGVRFCFI